MKTKNLPYSISLYFCILFTIPAILLSGCERIIDFNGSETESKLVMNSIISSEGQGDIRFSESKFIFASGEEYGDPSSSAPAPSASLSWENLSVKFAINGKDEQVYPHQYSKQTYSFTANKFAPGDKIVIYADVENRKQITAEGIVPQPPVILSVDTIRFFDKNAHSVYMRAMIKIKDNPGENNYYRLLINRKIYDINHPQMPPYEETQYYINQDIALSSLSKEGVQDEDSNLSRIFPDDLFQGKEYTINVYFILAAGSTAFKQKMTVDIELQSLSEPLYLYTRTLELSQNSDVFTQPVKIYSNVRGGYGILGIYNSTHYSFDVAPSAGAGREEEWWYK